MVHGHTIIMVLNKKRLTNKPQIFFCICFLFSLALQAQTMDEVIDKFYNATGGKENWQALKGYKTVYSFKEKGTQYSEEFSSEYPNKISTILNSKNGVVNTSFTDGNEAYETINGQRKNFEGKDLVYKKENAFFLPFLNYRDFNLNLESSGLKRAPMAFYGWLNNSNGNNCFAIRRNFANGKYTVYYFDTGTGYLVLSIDSEGSSKVYLKYEDPNGLGFLVPTKIISEGTGFKKTYELVSATFTKGEKSVYVANNLSSRSNTNNGIQTAPATQNENTISGVPTFYSLFIGIDKYQFSSANLPNLDKPVNDASSLKNVLLTNYDFLEGNSVFLKSPSRAEILKALETLAKKITVRDNLLIFYAGHGYWDERLKVGYWLPSDSKADDKSSWIPNSTIRDYIAGIQSKHTLLITDACFSGSIFKTREITSEINEYGVAKIYGLPSRKAMTSGTLTTVPDESKFMQYLLERLSDNTNKYLTARQLFSSLETAVINNTNTVPQLGVIQETGDEGGDFIFIRR